MSAPPDYQVRTPVQAPPAAPRPFGLSSVAVEGAGSPAAPPASFERGVDYYSTLCDARTGSLEGWCPEDDVSLEPFSPVRVEGIPFTVTSGMICGSPTFDAEAEALAQLARGEWFRVEKVFFDHQMSRPDLTDLGDEVELPCAMGVLESYAATHYGARPVVHAPLSVLPALIKAGQVKVNQDRSSLMTPWGTPVVAGAGYPQSDPATLLITGQVTLWRTTPFVNSDFDPRKNQQMAVAERTYAVTADCLAAKITIPGCPGAEGSGS